MTCRLELLAPARDLQTARAAIAAGADAVFIGGPAFGARAAAGNSLEELASLCRYAHRFGVKIHLTLNTLLRDAELPQAQELIHAAARCGVDALIVQDPAVFLMQIPRGLELHVSTQCNCDSLEKLKFYEAMGCAQVVLPRESSLADIAAFHQACPQLRLEVFVAGALCVGQSGICHISEFMQGPGRSANRGACAQICRLPMDLYAPDGRLIKSGHLLSLKDNLSLQDLPALIEAGAVSFKIEGRLKDADYTANLTAAFSDKLNEYIEAHPGFARASCGLIERRFTPDPARTFNRGFTAAYLKGSNDDLSFIKSPKFTGPRAGTVTAVSARRSGMRITMRPQKGITPANGDGFTWFDRAGVLQGFRAGRVEQAGELYLLDTEVRLQPPPGTTLYRNVDAVFLQSLHAPKAMQRRMRLCLTARFAPGRAEVSCGDELGRTAVAELALPPPAPGALPLPARVIESKCMKSPEPDFVVQSCSVSGAGDAYLPVSALNELRRRAFALYLSAVESCSLHPEAAFTLPEPLPAWPAGLIDPRLILNKQSLLFYRRCGSGPADHDAPDSDVLMTCRNCLIKNFARCSKNGGKVSGFSLKIGHKNFALRSDCRRCRMLILKPGSRTAPRLQEQ